MVVWLQVVISMLKNATPFVWCAGHQVSFVSISCLSSYLGRGGRGPLGGGPGQGGNWEAEPPTEGMLIVGGVDWWCLLFVVVGCWIGIGCWFDVDR